VHIVHGVNSEHGLHGGEIMYGVMTGTGVSCGAHPGLIARGG
jgi:hypothetical protein